MTKDEWTYLKAYYAAYKKALYDLEDYLSYLEFSETTISTLLDTSNWSQCEELVRGFRP